MQELEPSLQAAAVKQLGRGMARQLVRSGSVVKPNSGYLGVKIRSPGFLDFVLDSLDNSFSSSI